MATGKVLLVGAGNIGQRLLTLLDEDLQLVCIDRDRDQLEQARGLRPEGLETVCGDATSRLQLEDLGLGEIDTAIIATTSERVNIEVARVISEHFDVPQVIAVGITGKGIAALEELDVEVEDLFQLCASGIVNRLEPKTKTAIGIGLGRNEILQVDVHPDSRLANKRLALFHPGNWRIGVIYREDKIIVPRGSTVLRPRDKVVLLGEPRAIRTMAERLAFKFTDFPLEFGDTLLLYLPAKLDAGLLDETRYLCELLPVEKLLAVAGSEEWRAPLEEIAPACGLQKFELVVSQNHGGLAGLPALVAEKGVRPALVVTDRKQVLRGGLPWLQAVRTKRQLLRLAETLHCPLLLAAGTFPYRQAAIPSLTPQSLERSLEAALELSSLANFRLEVLAVEPSRYVGTQDEQSAADAMEKVVAYLARTYKRDIPETVLQGNPIHALAEALENHQLLFLDMDAWKKPSLAGALLAPDVGWETVRRAALSCVLIPPGSVFE